MKQWPSANIQKKNNCENANLKSNEELKHRRD
jgi:hypothetical protein